MKSAAQGRAAADPSPLCVDPIDRVVDDHPGIVGAEIADNRREVTLAYDPDLIGDREVERVARVMVPQMRRDFERCTMRLHGRACEACAARLEHKAKGIPGVRHATATFVGSVMSVTFDRHALRPDRVVAAVKRIGAPVTAIEGPPAAADRREAILTAATLVLLIAAGAGQRLGLAVPWPAILFTLAYIAGGWFGVQASWQSLKQATIDVDLLMLLAALGAAYVGHPFEGATLLFLFSLSNVLQSHAIERTRRAIHALMRLRPDRAMVRRGGATVVLPIEQLALGDRVIVRPGERLPLDGVVAEGVSAVDESSLTGESIPVDKSVGDKVFAGTINQSGGLEVRVTKLAKDSAIARLIEMVEEAQSEKAQTQRWLDRAEQFYAGAVLLFTAALIVLPPLVAGQPFAAAFYRAMTVMVVASPCALIISTPATILSAIGGAAKRGVLFKGGAHLERTAAVRIVVFDKTGTLTEGKPQVTDVWGDDPAAVLRAAAAVEAKSEHPLAQAIVAAARDRGVEVAAAEDFQSVSGAGASARVAGACFAVGNSRFFAGRPLPAAAAAALDQFHRNGKTAVIVARLGGPAAGPTDVLGLIAVADVLRPDAPAAIDRLRRLGVERVVMLTGDNRHVAAAIGGQAGVDEIHAELRPEDKMRIIKELQAGGPVAMVGDGVNDAPALAVAAVGIAMGAAGADVAMETADVVLMSNNLGNVAFAIGLSRRAQRVIWQNLAFALGVIVLLVAAALGLQLPLTLGVVGHEGSTVLVCLNGLRLLAWDGKR